MGSTTFFDSESEDFYDTEDDQSVFETVVHGGVQKVDDTLAKMMYGDPEFQEPTHEHAHTKHKIKHVQHFLSEMKSGHDFTRSRECSPFNPPMNSQVKCKKHKCIATCMKDHEFPDQSRSLMVVCNEGKWLVKGTEVDLIPNCHPICRHSCLNGGICSAPDTCNCKGNYFGASCEFERIPCKGFPDTPDNSHKVCTSEFCTISCHAGHQFPDGSGVTNIMCKSGKWVAARPDWDIVPPCKATCSPPCLNGGACLSLNTCQCPQKFRGPQCQYSIDACDVKKLQFNGNYECSGDSSEYSCVLTCPPGMYFEFTPESVYKCKYSEGFFTPTNIPKCTIESSRSHTIVKETIATEYGHSYAKSQHHHHGGVKYTDILDAIFLVEIKKPSPGACFTWNKKHFRTFDGKLYSVGNEVSCSYILMKSGAFSVAANFGETEACLSDSCVKQIIIYIGESKYKLGLDALGQPELVAKDKIISIPNQLDVLKVEKTHKRSVLISFEVIGVTLEWNAQDYIRLDVTESLWNSTSGLCGHLDGDASNDLLETNNNLLGFLDKYRSTSLASSCVEENMYSVKYTEETQNEGAAFCKVLLDDSRFSQCRAVLSSHDYYEACLSDFCSCEEVDKRKCACKTLHYFVQDCSVHNASLQISWRNEHLCPMNCPGNKIYSACVPQNEATCFSDTFTLDKKLQCSEGCTCPPDTVLHNETCIPKSQCPCALRGKHYATGEKIWKNCNTCSCLNGQWSCTSRKCPGVCSAIGDPHYTTFDGLKFNFMGKCSYTLMKAKNYSIDQENIACSGAISQAMGLSVGPGTPSCTRSVTITIGDAYKIKLKENKVVTINNEEVTDQLPLLIPHAAYIRFASSIFLQVELPDLVEIWWDGATRVYVKAPSELYGKTKGLCGTFNENQKDDFLSPEGDIEPDIISFANKWKTHELCQSPDEEKETAHPCDLKIQNKHMAQEMCKNITGKVFGDCHLVVDPTSYYDDCLYDLCSCSGTPLSQCFCPILAAYAKDCSHQGVPIEWRNSIRECGIQCPSGQEFQSCGNSCHRTCSDISHRVNCESECVEGCNCAEGFTLDKQGECIPIERCPCIKHGLEYPSRHKEIRPHSKGLQLCECRNAVWDCKLATDDEIKTYPHEIYELSTYCNASQHLTFTHCEPVEPVTCHNMGKHVALHSPAVCRAGCVCKKGYVLDGITKQCVLPQECPCHHGGKSYQDGETIKDSCNTCKCNLGHWDCTKQECPGVCTAWGDSHFKTFDARNFDFQGACEYVLVKGANEDEEESFLVVIEVVPCGSTGVSCSKSVKVSTGTKKNFESLTLTRNKKNSELDHYQKLNVREVGMYVFVELSQIGVTIQWDKGTRVSVIISPKWKHKVKGLCGNYNGNELDDFESPSGGISEVSPVIFGDSWRLHSYCPPSTEVQDTCSKHPNRKLWSLKQCNVLKSDLFQPCHSEVSVDTYFERCVFDSCACDEGGDCECLCTALAAYAQECNANGVNIRWRSQLLCPMQCDETCSHYEPCMSACPVETCHNSLDYSKVLETCEHEVCIEGCKLKPCPDNQIYNSTNDLTCVNKASCKHVCMKVDGKTYYEGDLMEEDDCHSCYCSRSKKTCSGSPCTTPAPTPSSTKPTPTPEDMNEQSLKCQSGWSRWINTDIAITNKKRTSDVETLPSLKDLAVLNGKNQSEYGQCSQNQMTDISCRVVGSHQGVKETGENVECSLERGLLCEDGCSDYEMKVFCECEKTKTSVAPVYIEANSSTSEVPDVQPYAEGCKGGEWKECVVECNQVCHSYQQKLFAEGKCTSASSQCVSGCWIWGESEIKCPLGSMWRDWGFCVKQLDCTCLSRKGDIVKPGGIVFESECEICQCVNNHYTCDTSICKQPTTQAEISTTPDENSPTTVAEKVTSPATTMKNIIILSSTVTPPLPCAHNWTDLAGELPDEAFTASSFIQGTSSWSKPWNARLSSSSFGSWKASMLDEHQYLDVNLGAVEPVYGVVTRGNQEAHEFVTSFKVMFSSDGVGYSYVLDEDHQPKIFRGPIDNQEVVTSIFPHPIEAKYIRINPNTWQNEIALNLQILGCKEISTSVTIIPSTVVPVCTDSMGLHEGLLSKDQVTVSSSRTDFNPQNAALSSVTAWIPFSNSPNEWIQFDFLSARVLTGVSTKGSDVPNNVLSEEEWVEAFQVQFSQDGEDWNKILDDQMKEKTFAGNFDAITLNTVYFNKPLNARFVRIYPTKWHKGISLRIEILGCFKPYPTTLAPSTTPVPNKPKECRECPGLKSDVSLCVCNVKELWDGENCVNRTQCPCYVGHMAYSVGTTYNTETCEQCTCGIGGMPICQSKHCEKCADGLRSKMGRSCECECEACPPDTKLCPTSNVCVNASRWCDGIRDCPDDEMSCEDKHLLVLPTHAPHKAEMRTCPPVSCPNGFTANITSRHDATEWSPFAGQTHSSFFKTEHQTVKRFVQKTGNMKSSMVVKRTREIITEQIIEDLNGEEGGISSECPQYQCVPIISNELTCSLSPKCPQDYVLEVERSGKCPEYFCVPVRKPDSHCNITSRTFHTFDNMEYKYDICNHVVAMNQHNKWKIILKKSCSYIGECSKSLVVHQFNQTIEMFTNLTVLFNGFQYSVAQVQKICDQEETFRVKQISDAYLVFGSVLDFSIIWDNQGNVRLTVPNKLSGSIVGLCGYFDGKVENDKLKPDGQLALTSTEFGDAWKDSPLNNTDLCEIKVCPLEIQNKAWELCKALEREPLDRCGSLISIDKAMADCVESMCVCLEGNNDEDKCRCQTLNAFVTNCKSIDSSVDLSGWRMTQNCAVECQHPFVYKECFDRVCELSCADLMGDNPCPQMPNHCFPGCYCPDGYVKEGSQCIKPSDCRDCICDGFDKSRVITFDRIDYTFNSNCSYVLSETDSNFKEPEGVRVVVSNEPCHELSEETCVRSLTIFYKQHSLTVKTKNYEELELTVDHNLVTKFPHETDFANATWTPGSGISVSLPDIHLNLIYGTHKRGFSLRVPSHLYYGATQGLCGSCNLNQTDDLRMLNGTLAEDINQFVTSWKYVDVNNTLGFNDVCSVVSNEKECVPPPEHTDPCLRIMDTTRFGRCHPVVDPTDYIWRCHQSLCSEQQVSVCTDLEAYVRECQNAGICLDWRSHDLCPYQCPPGLDYKPCSLGCMETCDSYQMLRENPNICFNPIQEACVCPPGKVFNQDECIDETRCAPCDTENHYLGDVWHPTNCTTCRCATLTSVECETKSCPLVETICATGFRSVIVKGTEDDCCPSHICVPEPTSGPVCPDPQKPICGPGQVLKLDTLYNGCQEFICQCKPPEECDAVSLESDAELMPGMIKVINNTGCCPSASIICSPETCPAPPLCPMFQKSIVKEGGISCCPEYECELPPSTCVHTFEYTSNELGGEKIFSQAERHMALKHVGDVWHDGPCRKCECLVGDAKSHCAVTFCPRQPVMKDYILLPTFKPNACCPEYRKNACKHEDVVYNVGSTWHPDPHNLCKNITCVLNADDEVAKVESIQTCNTECALGWSYESDKHECCGQCVPHACVVGSTEYKENEVWYSEDKCTSFTCEKVGEQFQVVSSGEQCPDVSHCPENKLYQDGCCEKCNLTIENLSTCYPQVAPELLNVRAISVFILNHGQCSNHKSSPDLTLCKGPCPAKGFYNSYADTFDSTCECCQATEFKEVEVPLTCADGYELSQTVKVASECSCTACGGQIEPRMFSNSQSHERSGKMDANDGKILFLPDDE